MNNLVIEEMKAEHKRFLEKSAKFGNSSAFVDKSGAFTLSGIYRLLATMIENEVLDREEDILKGKR